jgi:hypothetical protein
VAARRIHHGTSGRSRLWPRDACQIGSSAASPSPSYGSHGRYSPVSFGQQIQTEILTPACTSCHTDEGRAPSEGLNLKAGAAYANLVGVASSEKAGAIRVIARNPSASYLVQKLEKARRASSACGCRATDRRC